MSKTPLEFYERATALGVEFRLLGGGRVEIHGPRDVLDALDPEIARHGKWIVPVVEEFASPVTAAERLITARTQR